MEHKKITNPLDKPKPEVNPINNIKKVQSISSIHPDPRPENEVSFQNNLEAIQKIISERKDFSFLIMVATLILFFFYIAWRILAHTERHELLAMLINVFFIVAILYSTINFVINSINYPIPNKTYRLWNRWFYGLFSLLCFFKNVYQALRSFLNALNPLYGFKTRSLSRTDLFLDSYIHIIRSEYGYSWYKRALRVEEYFKLMESANKQN